MRSILIVILCSALAALSMGPASAATAQKSAKECRAEWRANKADNLAKGISERAFVKQCRAGAGTAAAPTGAAPATQATGAAAAPVTSGKTAAGTSAMPKATATPSGANQFAQEGQAKARCPSGTVVWVNLKSKVYHFSGSKNYGNTKRGAFMCETDANADGFRAAKNEKHPT
jgi:hypothetical protein